MAYLERFARTKREKEKSVTTTIKLPESTFYSLREYCESLGITVTEAIYLLVDRELKEAERSDIQSISEPIRKYEEAATSSIPHNTPRRRPPSSSSRFNTNEYSINDELPCPLCGKWVSRGNYARHTKGHDLTTQEMFEQHREKALEMVQQRKEALLM